jgi:hypothetical protein
LLIAPNYFKLLKRVGDSKKDAKGKIRHDQVGEAIVLIDEYHHVIVLFSKVSGVEKDLTPTEYC